MSILVAVATRRWNGRGSSPDNRLLRFISNLVSASAISPVIRRLDLNFEMAPDLGDESLELL